MTRARSRVESRRPSTWGPGAIQRSTTDRTSASRIISVSLRGFAPRTPRPRRSLAASWFDYAHHARQISAYFELGTLAVPPHAAGAHSPPLDRRTTSLGGITTRWGRLAPLSS